MDTFGQHRAIDLIWYTAWCNYMTRVADAFQFTLETENVFLEPEKKPEKKTDSSDSEMCATSILPSPPSRSPFLSPSHSQFQRRLGGEGRVRAGDV